MNLNCSHRYAVLQSCGNHNTYRYGVWYFVKCRCTVSEVTVICAYVYCGNRKALSSYIKTMTRVGFLSCGLLKPAGGVGPTLLVGPRRTVHVSPCVSFSTGVGHRWGSWLLWRYILQPGIWRWKHSTNTLHHRQADWADLHQNNTGQGWRVGHVSLDRHCNWWSKISSNQALVI